MQEVLGLAHPAVEEIELQLRKAVLTRLSRDVDRIPPHVAQKVNERIARALKKDAAMDADLYEKFEGKLEFFDLRELQDTIANNNSRPTKLDQLAELRNGIRHSRTVSEVVRKEREAALIWFREALRR